jgi:predicted metal-binding membrane protein
MNAPGLAESLLRRDRIIVFGLIGVLFMLAGLYTVYGVGMRMTALDMTAMRGMRDMPGPSAPGNWSLAYALLVFLMWWVMMTAMMLPSVSPTVLLYAALLRRGSKAVRVPAISTAFLTGYLAAWAGFSAIAAGLQWALEALGIVSATMMTLIQTVPGALVLIAAGVFQFTPLKQACLRHCRSPVEFITQRRRAGTSGALAMGIEHGVYCLGCCWFLMALLFVGGIMNLYWIVGLAAFVAIEKLVPHGHLLSKIAGTGLILWGGVVLWYAL